MTTSRGNYDQELQDIAQADYGKDYDELSATEKQHCGGKKGGSRNAGNTQGSRDEGDATEQHKAPSSGSNRAGGAGDEELEKIAQAEYSKSYSELDSREQQHCAGKKGAAHHWGNQSIGNVNE